MEVVQELLDNSAYIEHRDMVRLSTVVVSTTTIRKLISNN